MSSARSLGRPLPWVLVCSVTCAHSAGHASAEFGSPERPAPPGDRPGPTFRARGHTIAERPPVASARILASLGGEWLAVANPRGLSTGAHLKIEVRLERPQCVYLVYRDAKTTERQFPRGNEVFCFDEGVHRIPADHEEGFTLREHAGDEVMILVSSPLVLSDRALNQLVSEGVEGGAAGEVERSGARRLDESKRDLDEREQDDLRARSVERERRVAGTDGAVTIVVLPLRPG